MPINLGASGINKIYLGATEIQKVYLGASLIFSNIYSFINKFATSSDTDADGVCEVIVTFNTDGTVTVTNSDSTSDDLVYDFDYWHDAGVAVPGIGNSRWAKKTLLNESDITQGTLGTSPTSLSAPRTVRIQLVAGNPEETRTGEVLIEIYNNVAGTLADKVGEIYLTVTAQSAGQGGA